MTRMPVVVGYNGRRNARAALQWAAGEAARRGAPLMVLFAANYPGMVGPPGRGLFEQEPGALVAAHEVTARGVSEVLKSFPDLSVVSRTEVTSPAAALISISSEAAMVVIGSRGRGSVMAGLMGSVGFAIAGSARCPLVVVKEGHGSAVSRRDMRVVVGTDGSSCAEAAVGFAADYAESTSALLEIICCTGEMTVSTVAPELIHAAAGQIVQETRNRLEQTHRSLLVEHRVVEGPAEQALVDASRYAALVVVGSRGRGAFKAMVAGSTACAVIHGAAGPVAVVGGEPARGGPV